MTEQRHRIEWTQTYHREVGETMLRNIATCADWLSSEERAAARAKLAQLDAEREAAKTTRDKAEALAGPEAPPFLLRFIDQLADDGLLAPDEPPKLLIDYLLEEGYELEQIKNLAKLPFDRVAARALAEAEAAGRDLG